MFEMVCESICCDVLCLVHLHQLDHDHDVTVLEASPGPRGGGYMIDFFGPGVAAAERMGVLEELRSRGTLFNGARWERPNRRITGRIDVTSLIGDGFEGYFSDRKSVV